MTSLTDRKSLPVPVSLDGKNVASNSIYTRSRVEGRDITNQSTFYQRCHSIPSLAELQNKLPQLLNNAKMLQTPAYRRNSTDSIFSPKRLISRKMTHRPEYLYVIKYGAQASAKQLTKCSRDMLPRVPSQYPTMYGNVDSIQETRAPIYLPLNNDTLVHPVLSFKQRCHLFGCIEKFNPFMSCCPLNGRCSLFGLSTNGGFTESYFHFFRSKKQDSE